MVKTHQYLKLTAVAALALSGLIAAPAKSNAGTATTSSGKESKPLVEEVKKSCITGDLGVTFVTKYISRGIVLEDQGVIAQPYADLYFKVYDGGDDAFLNSVTVNLGIWSSIHSHHPGNTSSTPAWYEFDWTPGLAFKIMKNFTLTASYFEFDSPNDSFGIARSVNVNLAYDDTDLLGAFALHPHVTVLRELQGGSLNGVEGVAGIQPDGWYYEVGIAPTVPLIKEGDYPVTLTLPVTAGFGSNDFYGATNFGYFSAGGQVAVGLGFVPKCLGTWTTTVGATYYYLNGNVADINRGGEHNDWVGSAAVGCTF